ncbi:hypothetical protein BJ166DRAFT_569457 [Pestalotiopsis sp. NC0098]|nr:hypothetical protein BJ166DRAFT_569457 [Pestalotiopsis sp. NC0098]
MRRLQYLSRMWYMSGYYWLIVILCTGFSVGLLFSSQDYYTCHRNTSVPWQWSKNSCSALPVHTYVMPRIAAVGAKKNTMADQSINTDN